MILTVTLNPSIDVTSRCNHVSPDRKLRCRDVQYEPGGGGLNVCRAVGELGGQARAVWLAGGSAGRRLNDLLDQFGLPQRAVEIAAETRHNTYVHEDSSDREYRFILPGPEVTPEELSSVGDAVAQTDDVGYLVLSGSLPPGVPVETYARLAERAPGARVVVDAGGAVLRASLSAGIFLAKPNIRELADYAGRDSLDGENEIADAAVQIVDSGAAEYVLVSLGSGGAMLVGGNRPVRLHAPTVPIRSKIGAGDSMVAGVVLGFAQQRPPKQAAWLGVAAGSAAVMTPGTQLCRREDAERLYEALTRSETE